MAASDLDRQCQNCGLQHGIRLGMLSTNCNLLTVRTHKKNRLSQQSQFPDPTELETQAIPINIRDQAHLFDDLWFNFIDYKRKIDRHREQLAPRCKGKGALKLKAPLVWLSWQRWDGKQGQTRNQENWDRTWKDFVERSYEDENGQVWRQPVAWVTMVRYVDPVDDDMSLSPPLSASSSESSNSLVSSLPPTPMTPFLLYPSIFGQDISALQGFNRWDRFPASSTLRPLEFWDGTKFHPTMYQTPPWAYR